MPNNLKIDYQKVMYNTSMDTHEVGIIVNLTDKCSALEVETFSRHDIIANNFDHPMSPKTVKEKLVILPFTEDTSYHRIRGVTSKRDKCTSEGYYRFQQRGMVRLIKSEV